VFLCYNFIAVQQVEAAVDNQAETKQDSGKSDTTASPSKVTKPRNSETAQPATAQQLTDVERQMSSFERATLRWAKIAVCLSGVAALFVCAQWYEMRKGGKDTRTLAQAADTQAKRMADMSTAADKIREAAQNLVIQDQRIADNAHNALDASNKQTKTALDSTREAMQLEQRAWVSEMGASVEAPEVGKPLTGSVSWRNTGKTFAKHVRPLCYFSFVPAQLFSEALLVPGDASAEYRSVGVLSPGAQYPTHWTSKTPTTELDKSRIAGAWYTYVWGDITYSDIFSHNHVTTFCVWRQGSSGDFLQCPFHNDAD